jgi:cell wall-associated NlpC family hydrolase
MVNGFGVTLALTGSWLTYCAVKNVAPIQTLTAIIRTPASARQIISQRDYPIDGQTAANMPGANVSGANAGAQIVAFARNQIGKPYVFGGTGNPGWDCSGLTQAALASVGVTVPHSAAAQLLSTKAKTIAGSKTDFSKMLPGDIIFPDYVGDHVGIYAGNGLIIHAPKPGSKVSEIPVWAVATVKRFA